MAKVDAKTRREELKELVNSVGIWNINYSSLGRKYKVSHVTIVRDFEKIMSDTDSKNFQIQVQKLSNVLDIVIKGSLRTYLEALNQGASITERVNAARAAADVCIKYLENLQRLGYHLPEGAAASDKPFDININIVKDRDQRFSLPMLKRIILERSKQENKSVLLVLKEILALDVEVSNIDAIRKWVSEGESVVPEIKEQVKEAVEIEDDDDPDDYVLERLTEEEAQEYG